MLELVINSFGCLLWGELSELGVATDLVRVGGIDRSGCVVFVFRLSFF